MRWKEGWLAFYDYEDFPMDLGDMSGVHGLTYLVKSEGKWVDAWAGKWMTRHKNNLRNPRGSYVRTLLGTDIRAWVVAYLDDKLQLVGIVLADRN